MNTTVLRPGELTDGERARWDAACDASPALAHPTFTAAFATACAEVRPGTRVAVASDAAGRHLWFAYELAGRAVAEPVGRGVSDKQGVVAEPGMRCDPGELLRACGLVYHRFHALHPLAHPFGTSPPRSLVRMGRTVNPVADLAHGWPAYLDGLRRRSRSTLPRLRRHERRLAEAAPLRFVFDEKDPAALLAMARLKAEHQHRTGYPDQLAEPGRLELLRHLLDRPSPGCTAALSVLYAGDRPVAFWYSLRSRSVLNAAVTAYDPVFARYSPGLILLLKVMEEAARAGVVLVDIGTGDLPYKRTFATRELGVVHGALVRPSPAGLALAAADGADRLARDAVTARPLLRRAVVEGLHRYGAWRSARRPAPVPRLPGAGGSSAAP